MLKSFFLAGFECTYALSEYGTRFDLLKDSKHDDYCREDYRLIKQLGIKTVREGFSWHHIDKGNGIYDYSRYIPMLEIGKEEDIEQIWDFNHFDFPEGLDVLSDEFINRFKNYAVRTIKLLRKYSNETLYVVLFNEISYFAWIGANRGLWAPYLTGTKNSTLFKIQLIKATIAATIAIREIDSNVRFIQVEPLMLRKAKSSRPATLKKVEAFNKGERFQTWDMLSGMAYPELGGKLEYLDILGINYYISNQQWVMFNERSRKYIYRRIGLNDPGRTDFSELLKEVYLKYKKPMIVSETGSYGELRMEWWKITLLEIQKFINTGIPLHGVCIYPVLDNPRHGHFLADHSGIWDFETGDEKLKRIPHEPSLNIIKPYIHKWQNLNR